MALNYNRVMIAGNLTRDPQVRFLSDEKAVANFGLAINRRFKGADGAMQEETTFVDVEAWGRTAELVGQYLVKGRGCFVEGRLKFDTWEKDGVKQSKLRVVADNVQFTEPRTESGDATPAAAPARPQRPERRPTETGQRAIPMPPVTTDEDGPPF